MGISLFLQRASKLKISNYVQFWFLSFIFSLNCFADNRGMELTQKINAIEKKSNAIMGITAIHIEKNKVITHNSDQRFFMASTIKLPMQLAF